MAKKRSFKDLTGFFPYTDADGKVQPGKTLWDWLELLIVPIVLALGTLLFSYFNRQSDLITDERRRQSDLALAEERLQVERLNGYFAKMEGYILNWKLLDVRSMDQDESSILPLAQSQTVTALRSLDQTRRNIVFQFLRDTDLIDFILVEASLKGIDLSETNMFRANLSGADLWRTDLRKASLSRVDLSQAILQETNLSEADLRMAILVAADLSGADLSGADLRGACLAEANITQEQLDSVKSHEDAVLPGEDKEKCGSFSNSNR